MTTNSVSNFWWAEPAKPDLTPVSQIGCDAFERALLPIIRNLTITCIHPERLSWISTYEAAGKHWGVRTGFPLVHGLSQIVVALLRVKGEHLDVLININDLTRDLATRDEQMLLLIIHQLRRNHFYAGCDFMLDLVNGQMDTVLMDEVLAFAQRHSCGTPQLQKHDGPIGQGLRLVH